MADEHHPISAQLLKAAAQASAQDSSGESAAEDDVSPDSLGASGRRKKRSRACQACRNMKIRCDPVDGQEACKSCAKVNRECIMPGPVRKRQKTVHKVAELEKKIDALTQSLLARKQSHPTPPQDSPAITEVSRSSMSGQQPPQLEREVIENSVNGRPSFDDAIDPNLQQGRRFEVQNVSNDYSDVIDRGILDLETASRTFDFFVKEMNPMTPLVAFPEGSSVRAVRRSRPMVFLTALVSASAIFAPDVQSELHTELAQQLATRVMYICEKSVDLVQSMLLSSAWVGRHKDSKDLGFNQYIHSASVMALELGMGRRRQPSTKPAKDDLELRRTWLACYYNAMCVSTTMRQPALIRNSVYIEECLTVLSTNPAANPLDKRLCGLIRLIQIMEDVARCFHMDDPASSVRLEDSATQYQLKLFEKRLAEWKVSASGTFHPIILEHIDAVCSLFIHEISLHDNHNIDDFRVADEHLLLSQSLDPKPSAEFITTSHLASLTTCVCEMKRAITSFISTLSEVTKIVPCLQVVWTAYAIVAMIRLRSVLQSPGSKYADVFMPDLEVEGYLDTIIRLFTESMPAYPPLVMFVQAFQKLKMWHKHRSAGVGPEDGKTTTQTRTKNPQPTKAGNSMQYPVTSQDMGSSGAYAASAQNPVPSSQGMESMLLANNMPIDSSMFENQDWNFTLDDWNNFDASLSEPLGSAWIGYLI